MGISVDFNKVRDKLSQISKKIQNEVLDEALEDGSKIVLKRMQKYVPKKTFDLQKSLGVVETTGKGTQRKIIIGIRSTDRDIIERGYYQEYGTKKMVGKKWMKRSFKDSAKESNEAIIKSIKNNLKV